MKFAILCSFLMCSFLAYSYQTSYQEAGNICRKTLTKTMDRIIEEQPDSIAYYNDHKYYLKGEHIQVTPIGIVLSNQSSSIPISALFSNDNGCYLESEFKDYQQGPIMLPVICANCGKGWFYSDYCRVCPRCGTPP